MLTPDHPAGASPAADWLRPSAWPAGVGALMSSRHGGVSQGPWQGLNLRPPEIAGTDLDDAQAVRHNQAVFAAQLEGARPVYLSQVHGTRVVRLHQDGWSSGQALPEADASVTDEVGVACTVLVADCLPVLLATADGQAVGAAHAGWRGLAAGVLENTVDALLQLRGHPVGEVQAWLGACIGPTQFEVGDDVRQAFAGAPEACFSPGKVPGKWWADLPALARWRLTQWGVQHISGGLWCTASDASRFFSFRRDRVTGRHAAAIWRR